MKFAQYLKDEQIISLADESGILERWRFGRRLLTDPQRITAGGQLRPGVTARLIEQVRLTNLVLSEREIQWRMQCARMYPTESQIRRVLSEHHSWTALINAKFPAYSRDHSELDYDPRNERTRQRPKPKNTLPESFKARELWPRSKFGPASTIRELADYAEEMQELTGRFAARDDARTSYLAKLRAKAGITDSTAWADADDELDLFGESDGPEAE